MRELFDLWLTLPLWGQALTIVLTVLLCAGIHLGAWCQVRTIEIFMGMKS